MNTINNKTQNSLAFQHPAVFIANGINNGGGVTSSFNDTKKSLYFFSNPLIEFYCESIDKATELFLDCKEDDLISEYKDCISSYYKSIRNQKKRFYRVISKVHSVNDVGLGVVS